MIAAAGSARTVARQRGAFSGVGVLLRFMLRRDRIRFPAWVLGLTALMTYFANAIGTVLDREALAGMAGLFANPMMALVGGPGYGFDHITIPRVLAGMYGLYVMLGAAVMSIMTVSRHTRVEEQTGRSELVRANVVGRHAQLTAALILTAAMNLLVSAFVALVIISSTIDPRPDAAGALLFGASVGAAGIAFTGVAAITVQLSPFSRAGSGIAGAVVGVAFVLRGLGDMSAAQDGGLAWLSWLSPLGWSQQTAPFTLDRWWPLAFSVVFAVVTAAAGYRLQSDRDLAAGVIPDRLGPPSAAEWLRSPLALAYRLQRPSLIGWSAAMLVAGITFGAFVKPTAESADGMPAEILNLMGGADGIVDGYLGFMGLYFAIIVAAYAIISIQTLRGEEQSSRVEPVLSTSVSRMGWVLSWTAVTAVGAAWLLALAGLGEGLGAAIGVGDWSLLAPTLLGHLVQVAAVWCLLGLAVALYGALPRFLGLAWAVFVYGTVMSLFGEMLELDESVLDTSPFQHVGQYPAGDISWGAVGALVVIAVVLIGLGAVAFRRRDLTVV